MVKQISEATLGTGENKMKILVTGAAGFIGYHLSRSLLETGHQVVGIDKVGSNVRLDILVQYGNFVFLHDVVSDVSLPQRVGEVDYIVHLAALPNVRESVGRPYLQIQQDVLGYIKLLEYARKLKNLKRLVYISSSSVYGVGGGFSETSPTIPISPYAVSKLNNENMNACYCHLYGIPITSLRFFTVYGAFGREKMVIWKFTRNISLGNPVTLFNNGLNERDFTHVSDVVDALLLAVFDEKSTGHNVYNVGTGSSVSVLRIVRIIEELLGKTAILKNLPPQPGDIPKTCADITKINSELGYSPKTNITTGLRMFCDWFTRRL